MDVRFEKNGVGFVWDAEKAHANLRKHEVTFERATEAFFDPFLRVVDASTEDEARDAVLGTAEDDELLFVVHIAFEHDIVRIISARKAARSERRIYEE